MSTIEECSNSVSITSAHSSSVRTENRAVIGRKRAMASLAIFTAINLLNYTDRYIIPAVLVDLGNYFRLDDKEKGLIQTVFLIVYLLSAPVCGFLGDRFNRKYILMAAVLIWTSATLFGSFLKSDQFYLFLIARSLVGLGESGYLPVCYAMIGDLFCESERMMALSVFSLAIPIGCGFGYIVGSTVTSEAEKLGADGTSAWKYSLRVTPICGAILVILTALFIRDPPRGSNETTNQRSPKTSTVRTNVLRDLRYLFTNKTLVFVCLGNIAINYVCGSFAFWGPDFLEVSSTIRGVSPNVKFISVTFGSITCLSGLAGVLIGGLLAKKLRPLHSNADPLVAACGVLFSAPIMYFFLVLVQYSTTAVYVWPLVALGEVPLFMNWVFVPKIITDCTVPHRRAFAFGLGNLLSHLVGDTFGIQLIGVISDAIYPPPKSPSAQFRGIQMGLFTCPIVCVLGAAAFSSCAVVYDADKQRTEGSSERNVSSASNIQQQAPDQIIDDMEAPLFPRNNSYFPH